jgi:hypothetical protein
MKCVLSHTECIFSSYFNEEAKVLYCALRDRCTRVQPLLFLTFCCVVSYNERFLTFCSSLSLSLSLSHTHTHTHTRTFCSSPFVVSCRMMYVRVYTHLCVHTLTHPPYYSVKRDLQYQKRPTTVSKETYAHLRVHTLTHPPTHPPTHPTHLLPPLCPKHLAPAHSYTSWKSRQ